MIFDKLKNVEVYGFIPKYACDFIKNLSMNISEGRYKLQGEDFVNIESYFTKSLSDAKYESHEKFIDIQILLSGSERIYYRDKSGLKENVPYNKEKDIVFYNNNVDGNYVKLDGTNFVILFPHEAHAPQIISDNSEKVKKVVLKIKV